MSSIQHNLNWQREQLIEQIPTLDLSAPPLAVEQWLNYKAFYGLDRLPDDVAHHVGFVKSDDFNVAVQVWLPEGAEKTAVLVHGYFDHVGLYRHVIEFALAKNYAVVAFDLPGHGLSSGDRVSIKNFRQYTHSLSNCLEHVLPSLPKAGWILGQSTGGSVVMDYLLSHSDQPFEKVVLFAPLLRVVGWPMVVLSHVFGRAFLKQVPRKFGVNSGDREFTSFLEVGDPMQSRFISVDWVGAMRRWQKTFSKFGHCEAPLLIVQGNKDETVDWRFNLPKIREHFPCGKVYKLLKAKHHLVNETEEIRGDLFREVEVFLSAQV